MKLPDKLSDLLELALSDLEAVEKQPDKYRVYMWDWHKPNEGICEVCWAGAVMANTLNADPKINVWPGQLDGDIAIKLDAIDAVRTGDHDTAACAMGIPPMRLDKIKPIAVEYVNSPEDFKTEARRLITDLRKVNL